jgi:hypothetical protein
LGRSRAGDGTLGQTLAMASYAVNPRAVARARQLIGARQRHKEVELAAHELLQYLDNLRG